MAKFRAIINAVRQAITGNATTADVLSGKTFMSAASPNEQTGAMTNNGAVSQTLTQNGQSYTIPAGYHDGTGTVTASISNALTLTKLWENESPTAVFTTRHLNLDLTDYDGVLIKFNESHQSSNVGGRSLLFKNDTIPSGFQMVGGIVNYVEGQVLSADYCRGFAIDSTGIVFNLGININNTNDGLEIPIEIYGVKGTL